jgi:hypothetical protein
VTLYLVKPYASSPSPLLSSPLLSRLAGFPNALLVFALADAEAVAGGRYAVEWMIGVIE